VTVSVIIADDHPIVLAGLEGLLGRESEFKIVARCVHGEEALEATRRFRPDLLVTDLNMPRMDGLQVMHAIHEEGMHTRVVLLVAEVSKSEALQALRLNVGGILLKELAPRMLISCLRKVHRGERWFEQRTLDALMENLLAREAGAREASTVLTARELEITRLVATGLRNHEIAKRLNLAEGTVKLHLHNTYRKLNLDSRLELTLYAQRKGLTEV
jgi:DNA-binding NarL/FixJ family response regulator